MFLNAGLRRTTWLVWGLVAAAAVTAPVAAQDPLDVAPIVTAQQLIDSGLDTTAPTPFLAEIRSDRVIFTTGFDADSAVVRAEGPGFASLSLEARVGQTPAPDTGNPILVIPDYGLTNTGTYLSGASNDSLGQLQPGIFARDAAGAPLGVQLNPGLGLPTLPLFYQTSRASDVTGFALGASSGVDAGAYFRIEGAGLSRTVALGDTVPGTGGAVLEEISVITDAALDGSVLTAVIEDSSNQRHLATLDAQGSVEVLLSEGDELTDDTAGRLRIERLLGAVAADGRRVVRAGVLGLDLVTDPDRDALIAVEDGVATVLGVTGPGVSNLAIGLGTAGGFSSSGNLTVFNLLEDGTESIRIYDGQEVTEILTTGDAFLGGTFLGAVFTTRSLDAGRFVFTAVYTDAAGQNQTDLVLATLAPEPETVDFEVGLAVGVSFASEAGVLYTVFESTDGVGFTPFATVEGTGSVVSVADLDGFEVSKLYRVEVQ